jgi:predicted naringenin-chalcone synthase
MMTIPAILGLATGVPAARYSQQEILEHLLERTGQRRGRAMRAIFERTGIGYRSMVVGEGYFDEERTTQDRNDFYMAEAVPLGERVLREGLETAGYAPEDVDDLIVVSCTGFNIPGLDLHLAGRLGMRPDLHRTCILGMGCYGAFPGLLRANEAVAARPGRLAVMLALELCSIHLQLDDSAESIVSAALFADGAAMALVGDETLRTHGGPKLIHAATHCDYTTLEHMSFSVTDHGFRMYLSSYVPDLLAAQIEDFVDRLLHDCGLTRDDVRFWGIHPGSTKVVDYVQSRLGLADAQVEFSHSVLYDYGNMSSATILFVLERLQQCAHPAPGDYGVLLAFGPGLTMEGMLVQW